LRLDSLTLPAAHRVVGIFFSPIVETRLTGKAEHDHPHALIGSKHGVLLAREAAVSIDIIAR
jgi:hypothetical protein